MFRLFVALPLPLDVRSRLAALCSGLPGARWVAEENLHLTLRFIGEVGRADAEDIHQELTQVRTAPFSLTISGTGCFETGHKVRALWAGVEKEERLLRLQEKVEQAMARSGYVRERRKFKPHITLARFRNGAPADRIGMYMQRNNTLSIGPVPANAFALFRSHLGGEGPHYEILAEYPLGGYGIAPETTIDGA